MSYDGTIVIGKIDARVWNIAQADLWQKWKENNETMIM